MGVIGEGTFGTVYLMENKLDQKKYALKVTNCIFVYAILIWEKLHKLHDIIPSFFLFFPLFFVSKWTVNRSCISLFQIIKRSFFYFNYCLEYAVHNNQIICFLQHMFLSLSLSFSLSGYSIQEMSLKQVCNSNHHAPSQVDPWNWATIQNQLCSHCQLLRIAWKWIWGLLIDGVRIWGRPETHHPSSRCPLSLSLAYFVTVLLLSLNYCSKCISLQLS
jgi:hypothetical protein